MNRLQKREEVWNENPYNRHHKPNILSICLDLRMSNNGSADPLHTKVKANFVKYLQCVLDTWETNYDKNSLAFDMCVKNLIISALKEIGEYNDKNSV